MRHKAAKGGKCRNGKSGKRKIWKAVCKIISWHYAYRMHELNNAAKDASLSVYMYFQPGVNLDHYSAESDVDDDDNQDEEVSVDSGNEPTTSHQRMLNLKICAKSA